MDNTFDKIAKIITLIISLCSLFISIVALGNNRHSYEVNKKKFEIDTNENLLIAVGINDVETLDLKYEEECNDNNLSSFLLNVSICFVNNSNLPIYIEKQYVSRYMPAQDGSFIGNFNLKIEELNLPIYIEPQETKFVDCKLRIPIPDDINEYIVEEFIDADNLDFNEIGKYLFFEKNVDIIGNRVDFCIKNGEKYYKYNPTIPFHISFWTTRGNYFWTEFYTGFFLHQITDGEIEYDNGTYIEVIYGKKDWKDVICDFMGRHIIIILLIVIIFFIFAINNLNKRRKRELKIQENNLRGCKKSRM